MTWNASWIWLRGQRNTPNCYVALRRQFRIKEIPRLVRFHVSAQTHYRLYLNDTEIGWGPNPSHPDRYYYDTYRVTSFLRKGVNTIAVLAYNHGYHVEEDTTFADAGGAFIFQAELESRSGRMRLIVSDDSWKVQRSPAWDSTSRPYVEIRHGFKEYVDGRKGVLDFIQPAYNDRSWARAQVLGKHPMEPFKRLVPREIKYFRSSEVLPRRATSIGYNYAYGFTPGRGWEVDDSLALVGNYPKGSHLKLFLCGEGGDWRDVKDKKGMHQSECTVQMSRPEEPPSILIDFGRLCVGRFKLEIDDAPAGARIDIGYGESLNITYIDRYICKKGTQIFSPYHRRVARYVLLTFHDLRKSLVVSKVAFDFITYPVKQRGAFKCSDDKLTRVWATARRTLHLTMYDHFEDCPWREQKLYAGDMHVQGLASYYAYGDMQYVRKCLRQIGLLPYHDGWIAAAGPGRCSEKYNILEYPARYIMSLRDYVLASGDMSLIKELYPIIQRQIKVYADMKHTRGLLDTGYAGGFENWILISWGEIHKQGVVAGFNFLVLHALEAAAQLAVWLGRDNDALLYQNKAAWYRQCLNDQLWDSKKGLYADCLAHGRLSPNASVETNTLAVLTRTALGKRRSSIIKKITSSNPPWIAKSPFFNCFVMEALFESGQYQSGLDIMRWYWHEMIDRDTDTFWEIFDCETPEGSNPYKSWSMCHGWSAGPLYLIGAYLLGVIPVEPGFRKVRIRPRPLGIEWAAGIVPTPFGDIHVDWELRSKNLNIKIPKQIEIDLCLDNCRNIKKVFLNGRRYRKRV